MLSFIFSSAAKHNVDSESLSSELQQLGLPKGESARLVVPVLEYVLKKKMGNVPNSFFQSPVQMVILIQSFDS